MEIAEEYIEKVNRFYQLTNEINDYKEAIKEKNAEINELYDSFLEYFKQSGKSSITTESGKFELTQTVKYNKKKRG